MNEFDEMVGEMVGQLMDMSDEDSDYADMKNQTRNTFKGASLRELAIEFKKAKEVKEKCDKVMKRVNGAYDAFRLDLIPEAMDREGLQSPVKLAGIGKISITSDASVTVVNGAKFGLIEWFKNQGLEDMVQPAINASTLKSFIMKRLIAGVEIPDTMITIKPFVRASLLK